MAAESSEPEVATGLSASRSLEGGGLARVQGPDQRPSPKRGRIRVQPAAEDDVVSRLAAFLTAGSILNPEAGVGPPADRARLLEEAAIALGAQRAVVIAAAPNGTCLCWAAYGLTPAQTRGFLTREWVGPPAAAPVSANPGSTRPVNSISDILEEESPDSPLVRAEQIELAGPGANRPGGCSWIGLPGRKSPEQKSRC